MPPTGKMCGGVKGNGDVPRRTYGASSLFERRFWMRRPAVLVPSHSASVCGMPKRFGMEPCGALVMMLHACMGVCRCRGAGGVVHGRSSSCDKRPSRVCCLSRGRFDCLSHAIVHPSLQSNGSASVYMLHDTACSMIPPLAHENAYKPWARTHLRTPLSHSLRMMKMMTK